METELKTPTGQKIENVTEIFTFIGNPQFLTTSMVMIGGIHDVSKATDGRVKEMFNGVIGKVSLHICHSDELIGLFVCQIEIHF